MMRKALILLCAFGLLCAIMQPAAAQEPEKNELQAQEVDTSAIRKRGAITYDPAGRRDPFRDLLTGQDVGDSLGAEGIANMAIDDVVLIGITKVRGKLNAVINGPQGFPETIKTGDKFADGFVLSIHESKVVFRKTRERGVPLYKPKDVVKEINPEER
jgi:Tfp pilus assembly protein PilP